MRCTFLQSRLLNSCRHAQQWRPNQVQDYLHRFKDKMAIPAESNVVVTAADLEHGSKSLMKRPVEVKHRRFLCSRRACYNLVLLLAVAAIIVCTRFKPAPEIVPSTQTLFTLPLPPSHWQRATPQNVQSTAIHETHIEDVVALDSGEVLVLVQIPSRAEFPAKERIQCRYGDARQFAHAHPLALHLLAQDRAAILCSAPPPQLVWSVTTILIEVDQTWAIRRGATAPRYQQPLLWTANNPVVYESAATDYDVVVFVHGINSSTKQNQEKLHCVFDARFETPVTSEVQEVVRCAHPPQNLISTLAGKKISLKSQGQFLPSLATYNPNPKPSAPQPSPAHHDVCACTMIHNGAKFLTEWIHYHAHLGIHQFFLYDNNSDDNLDDVIKTVTLNPKFNITKRPWPWVKTQEGAFSHCALTTQASCKWMLFADVDEFFFPHPRFLNPASSSALASFIAAAAGRSGTRVAQIMTLCYNFGPSGLTTSPAQGVTQGYTCRVKQPERHKAIVRLDAVAHSLANVVHHFGLRTGYETRRVYPTMAVINHYKFQAWDEFRVKFRRRAATYVADWTENRNSGSKDRVPDLGTRASKPADWEQRFCEVHDYGLRDYARVVFGSYNEESKLRLAWE